MRAVADPSTARRDPLTCSMTDGGMSHHGDEVALASRLHLEDAKPFSALW